MAEDIETKTELTRKVVLYTLLAQAALVVLVLIVHACLPRSVYCSNLVWVSNAALVGVVGLLAMP